MAEKKTKKKQNGGLGKVASRFKKAVKPKKKEAKVKAFEEKPGLQKIYIYIVVVEQPVANTVLKLLQNLGSSAQFVHNGRGTAPSDIANILNSQVDKKAIINAFVSEDNLSTVQEELTIFFKASKKNRGVGFAIPLSSIQGIRMYKYLTQTI